MANKVSIVLATYTGEDHIDDCLQSLLDQNAGDYEFEVVVVIDGPNKTLRQKVETKNDDFVGRGIPFTIFQFEKNQGRYVARLKGAQIAKNPQLLLVDDRSLLDANYLNAVVESGESCIISNAIESESPTLISRVLYLLRRKIYSGGWGEKFDSYYITDQNFEKSPKGTTGFWVSKKMFLEACAAIKGKNLKSVNEDTKLFKYILSQGKKLYKSSEAKVYYRPRTEVSEELRHLYGRGPRFVDYYFQKGTRYYKHIWLLAVLLPIFTAALVALPQLFIGVIIGFSISTIVVAVLIATRLRDILVVIVGLPLVVGAFVAGVIKGLAAKARR
ncbi:MAG: glycosyltransferase [Candidatus Saccharimonadales bacterium]